MLPASDLRRSIMWGTRHGLWMLRRDRARGVTFLAMLSAVFLVQLLLLILLAARAAHMILVKQGDVQIEVLSGSTDADIQEFYAALRALSFVDGVAYVPKEKAFEAGRKRDPGLIAFLEAHKLKNPFPDVFSVTLTGLDDYGSLRQFLEQPAWKSVVHPSFFSAVQTEEVRMRGALTTTRSIALVAGMLLLVSVAMIVFVLAERMKGRSGERELLELLGASRSRAAFPAVASQALLLLGALIVASGALLILYILTPGILSFLTRGFSLLLQQELSRMLLFVGVPLLAIELMLAPVLAWGGVMLGTRGVVCRQ